MAPRRDRAVFNLAYLMLCMLAQPVLADDYPPGHVTCVYPLSGQYAPIARYLYYCLLLFGIIARRETWLIAGALATALSYSATAAIHVFILAVTSANPVVDMDIAGVWAVLSAGLFALWPVLHFSSTFRKSPFRPVFRIWAVIISLGAISAMVLVYLRYHSEKECLSSTGVLMTQPYQVGTPGFSCTYTCFNSERIMRSPSEIFIMRSSIVFGDNWNMLKALAGFVANVGLAVTIACISWPAWRVFEPFRKFLGQLAQPGVSATPALTAEQLRKQSRKEKVLSYVFFINQAMSIISVIFNEYYLLRTGLPVEEQPYGISQWGTAVAVALAVCAALINRHIARQKTLEDSSKPQSFVLADSDRQSQFERSSRDVPYGKSFHEVPYGRSFNDLHGKSFQDLEGLVQTPKPRWRRFLDFFNPFSRTINPDFETASQIGRPKLKRHPTW